MPPVEMPAEAEMEEKEAMPKEALPLAQAWISAKRAAVPSREAALRA
jgi:hypothetical protein